MELLSGARSRRNKKMKPKLRVCINTIIIVCIGLGVMLLVQDCVQSYGRLEYNRGIQDSQFYCVACAELQKENNDLRMRLWNCRQGKK